MRIPTDKWTQVGNSDIYGALWSSNDLDLANKNQKGKLLFSPRTLTNITSSDDADLGLPVAFRYIPSVGWFAICGNKIFQNGSVLGGGMGANTTRSPFTSFIDGETTGLPISEGFDIKSDLEFFPDANVMVASTKTTKAYKTDGSSFTEITGAGGTGNFVKKLCYFRKRNRMYMSYGGRYILSYNSAYTVATPSGTPNSVQYAMDLGGGGFITTLLDGEDYMWILTISTTSNFSYQYLWDGSTEATPNDYAILETSGALCGIIKDNSLWIVDTEGRLMQNNGKAFVEKARFPFGGKIPKNSMLYTPGDSTPRWIHHNGMTIVDGKINILINNPFQDGTNESERCPAGVWEYDEEVGLYHKYSISYSPKATGAITDYGQTRLSAVGAIMSAKHTSTDNGNLLIGANYYSNATTVKSGIFINDSANTIEKYNYFVTQWISTSNIKENWNQLVIRIRKLLNTTDKIIVKYRTNEDDAFQITGEWTTTSSFNTATDLTNYVGYEMEILNGVGGGKPFHITSCVAQASIWNITLDETMTGATGTFIGRVQSWTKVQSVFTNSNEVVPNFALPIKNLAPRIQFKVCSQNKGNNQIFDMLLNSTKQQ